MGEQREEEPDWSEAFAELRGEDVEIDPFVSLSADDDDGEDEQTVAVPLIDLEAAEIRRGKRLLAKKHGTHTGPGGDPSVSEIKTMCAAIRSTWRGADLRRSRCRHHDRVEVKTVRVEGVAG